MKGVAVHVSLFLFLIASLAKAQTTRPAPAGFSPTVRSLAQVLIGGDITALSKITSADTSIASFDKNANDASSRLVAATSGGTIVAARCYGQLPVNLASDLATDFAAADYVPQSVRREMVPSTDQIVRANVTAGQWISQKLNPSDGDLVGVIVVWPPRTQVPINRRPDPLRPVFVLIKAQMTGEATTIKQIVFGNPLDAG